MGVPWGLGRGHPLTKASGLVGAVHTWSRSICTKAAARTDTGCRGTAMAVAGTTQDAGAGRQWLRLHRLLAPERLCVASRKTGQVEFPADAPSQVSREPPRPWALFRDLQEPSGAGPGGRGRAGGERMSRSPRRGRAGTAPAPGPPESGLGQGRRREGSPRPTCLGPHTPWVTLPGCANSSGCELTVWTLAVQNQSFSAQGSGAPSG